jgi:hypothetical protein
MPREQPGGNLSTAQAVSGRQVARAWLGLCYGTWEPVALNDDAWLIQPSGTAGLGLPARPSKGDPQAVDQQEAEYRRQRTGTDHLVVAVKPGNAGRAKGVGHPGQLWLANHHVWEELAWSVRSRAWLQGCHEPVTPRGVRPVL